ncbi:S-adenosylhomocysteine deaminase [Halobacteriales archaeon QS_5_70_15]|nr:MAG: S-adenosylhomocysteine deaminase [Halobacteriales archaeon QS_5_70_15]
MTLELSGGHVLRPDLTVERADVLVGTDAGEVLEVGDLAGTGDERLDCSGSLVIPGIVNAHTHAAMTLLRGYADDKPLEAWLREDVWPIEGVLEPADVRAGTELGVVEMLQSGVTAFADMYFHVPEVVDAVERAGLRARVGHGVVTVAKGTETAHDDAVESIEVAREYDGAADGRVRTAFMPHSLTTVGEEFLEAYVPEARELGVPVHLHASETREEVEPIVGAHGQRPLAYACDRGLLADGDFLAHGVHLDGSEIELLAGTGAGVVHCPASNMKLASGMAPVQRLLDAGVPVGLGTDGPASNNDLDLFGEMRDAAMLGKLAAGDASAVAAVDVVRMATEWGAEVVGLPAGRVEAGGTADLAVVDFEAPHLTPVHDHVSHLVYAARASDVRHTVCDGRTLVRDGEVTTLDESRVRAAATERAASAVERAGR